jgi:NAD(P)-dependent dehydrogenase (short-subunit alcohol dehydrogenase family)
LTYKLLETFRDVRVNAVALGPVETEMLNRFTGGGEGKANFLQSVPVKRAASPQEIADTILFLACKAPFLTASRSWSMGARPPLSGTALLHGAEEQ